MPRHILKKTDGNPKKTLPDGRVLSLDTVTVDGEEHFFLKLDDHIIDGDRDLGAMLAYHSIELEA